jgi:hypothetical protein
MTHKIKLMSRLMAASLPTPSSSHTRARIDLAVAAVMAHEPSISFGGRGRAHLATPVASGRGRVAVSVPAR